MDDNCEQPLEAIAKMDELVESVVSEDFDDKLYETKILPQSWMSVLCSAASASI